MDVARNKEEVAVEILLFLLSDGYVINLTGESPVIGIYHQV